jgi:hypothetical protein
LSFSIIAECDNAIYWRNHLISKADFMDKDIKEKLGEMAKKREGENRIWEAATKKEEDERAKQNEELRPEKENLLKEIKKELGEFEPMLLPLRRNMLDPQKFYSDRDHQFTMVATEDKRIEIFASGLINGHLSIFFLADYPQLQPVVLNLLRRFLNHLKQFEKYYADNVERYLK